MRRALVGSKLSLTIVSAAAVLVAPPVFGVDGVVEINQARAKTGGVTPGDAPKFPVTLDHPGSYRLTGNLDVTDATARDGSAAENTTAILVAADNVTVDLNGFTIHGPTSCAPAPGANCTSTGSGKGIDSAGHAGTVITNGTVEGMGSQGIEVSDGALIERIQSRNNGGDGISCPGNGAVVARCRVTSNGGSGILGAAIATESVAVTNHMDGIRGGVVASCFAARNGVQASGFKGIVADIATGSEAFGNAGSPDIEVFGVAGNNLCGIAPCP